MSVYVGEGWHRCQPSPRVFDSQKVDATYLSSNLLVSLSVSLHRQLITTESVHP